MSRHRRFGSLVFLRALLLVALGAGVLAARAEGGAPAPGGPAPAGAAQRPRERLDAFKARLDQIEAGLGGRDLSDEDLQRLRGEVDPTAAGAGQIVAELGQRSTALRARLDQLGPKPEANAPPESVEVARERGERQRDFAEVDESLRLGRALVVQGEQIKAHITDRRRGLFTRRLFERSTSILSPGLWLEVVRALPGDAKALHLIGGDWLSRLAERARDGRILAPLLALAAAAALYCLRGVLRARLAPWLAEREARVGEPTRLRRALSGVWRAAFAAVPAAAAAYLVYAGLAGADLLPARIEPVARAALSGIVFVAFAGALADALLAVGWSHWRVIEASDASAAQLRRFALAGALVFGTGKVADALLETIGASLASTVAAKGAFAVLFALLLANTLRALQTLASGEEASFGPYVATAATLAGPVRLVAWAAAAVVVVAALAGFVALASFLVDQIVWVTIVMAVLALALILVDDALGRAFIERNRVARVLRTGLGLRKASLDQFAVLASGILRLVLAVVAALLVLAPWGLESSDVWSSVRAAFLGFQIGDVTISLATIAVAALFFALGLGLTRAVQRWLDRRYLPLTRLDSGLRNSISTAAGYVGVFVAAAIPPRSSASASTASPSWPAPSRWGSASACNRWSTISSGLILLWERSIRVGDWIVVGTDEGHVRRINVRATEIETFDKAAVIVPNSNLISGVVKNLTHDSRTGRIVIAVTIAFRPDPRAVADLLVVCATSHPGVLAEPTPAVIFKKFSDTALEFELRCLVADVETALAIKSDLHFAIFARLTAEKIYIAPAPVLSEVKVRLPEAIEAGLARLVDAQQAHSAPSGSAPPQPS